MKKNFKWVLMVVAALLMFSLFGCVSQEEKDAVGKYNLTSISGISGVTVSSYEYNYIELKSNKTYHIENKVGATVTQQDGKWSIKDEKITLKITSGATTATAEYKIANNVITMTDSIVVSGTTYNVTMKLTKAAE